MDQYKPSMAHVHHTSFCMACLSLSFESASPVLVKYRWVWPLRYEEEEGLLLTFVQKQMLSTRAGLFPLGKELSAMRMISLRNSRQEWLKECLKGNQSYLLLSCCIFPVPYCHSIYGLIPIFFATCCFLGAIGFFLIGISFSDIYF